MKWLIPVLVVFVAVLFSFHQSKGRFSRFHIDGLEKVSDSSLPPTGTTGAPGEADCTACHFGTPKDAAGTINFTFSDSTLEYEPGQTYTISVGVENGSKNGFEMTILDSTDNAAGTFAADANSATITASGRNYIRHSNSSGVQSWTFDWTAPNTNKGDLSVYYAFNHSNDNNSKNGDTIYLGKQTLTAFVDDAGISVYSQLEKNFKVVALLSGNINITYRLFDKSSVGFSIYSMDGKLLYAEDFGKQGAGSYQYTIQEPVKSRSAYIVSLQLGEYVFSKRVYLP